MSNEPRIEGERRAEEVTIKRSTRRTYMVNGPFDSLVGVDSYAPTEGKSGWVLVDLSAVQGVIQNPAVFEAFMAALAEARTYAGLDSE